MKVYQVGGVVRDRLLGHPVKDRDWVVVGSTPEEMEASGFKPVGKEFPVFLHPDTHEEYALARTERKTGKGYKGFTFYTSPDVTLEDDLIRRDLTINAIAEDESGNIIDPFNGTQDIKDGILRHVSPAFAEDPLRVLRVARFAARFGFKIADETMALMKNISASGELELLVAERVWAELEQALACRYPTRFILVLRACNALKILFPEIDILFGIPQPKKYHPEIDTGMHTIMVLNQATRLTKDSQVRFSALVHDLGKGTTPKTEWPKHRGHENRGVKIIRSLCKRFKAPKQYQELAILVSKYHLDCHRILEMKPATVLKKLESLDAFRRPERFEQFLLACEADARGRTGLEDKEYIQGKFFREAFEATNQLDIQPLIESGITGEALGNEIKTRRIEILARLSQN